MTYIINCRARLVDDCLHGQPTARQFGADLPMGEDNTWDGKSIICDPCYVYLIPRTENGLLYELDTAIERERNERQGPQDEGV